MSMLLSKKLYIIKIGGSVATIKSSQKQRVRRTLLRQVCTEIQKVLAHDPSLQLIIIHGAGSFGHTLAHRYDLNKGTNAHKEGKKGVVLTRAAIQTLTTEVLHIALEVGLPAITLHTGSFFTRSKGALLYNKNIVTHLLNENYIPLLYGDMICDDVLGMSICSGDTIAAELTRVLSAEKLFFASDVDGIFTGDPYADTKAILIPEISLARGVDLDNSLSGSHNLDVTGGLKGKIEKCEQLFKTSTLVEIHIFNGLQYKNYRKALMGAGFPHTVIKRHS